MSSESPPYSLSPAEYELVGALAEAIIPTGENPSVDPGAREVGVKNFFDSTVLAMDDFQRKRTKEALRTVEERSRKLFNGKSFPSLSLNERGVVLSSLLTSGDTRQMYVDLRAICVSGFYSDYRDPDYTGVGAWDWLGYGGKRISGLEKDWSFLRVHQVREKKRNEDDRGES